MYHTKGGKFSDTNFSCQISLKRFRWCINSIFFPLGFNIINPNPAPKTPAPISTDFPACSFFTMALVVDAAAPKTIERREKDGTFPLSHPIQVTKKNWYLDELIKFEIDNQITVH